MNTDGQVNKYIYRHIVQCCHTVSNSSTQQTVKRTFKYMSYKTKNTRQKNIDFQYLKYLITGFQTNVNQTDWRTWLCPPMCSLQLGGGRCLSRQPQENQIRKWRGGRAAMDPNRKLVRWEIPGRARGGGGEKRGLVLTQGQVMLSGKNHYNNRSIVPVWCCGLMLLFEGDDFEWCTQRQSDVWLESWRKWFMKSYGRVWLYTLRYMWKEKQNETTILFNEP